MAAEKLLTHAQPSPKLQGSSISALEGNRAALSLLIIQNLVSGVAIGAGLKIEISLLLAFAGTVLFGAVFMRSTLKKLIKDTRFTTPPAIGTALGAFALAFMASRALTVAYVTLFPDSLKAIPQFGSSGNGFWLLMLGAGLLIPVAEEIAFRGLMMRGHERSKSFAFAAISSAIAFSVAHGSPAAIAGIFPLAYVLALLAQHTGSIWSGVIVHALNNIIAVTASSFLKDNPILDDAKATEMPEPLRMPVIIIAFAFGIMILGITHLWLKPKPDQVTSSHKGAWLSGSYVFIVLFGIIMALSTLPAIQALVHK